MTPTENHLWTILNIIRDEPELPGPMPDQVWENLKQSALADDREAITLALRIAVRLTKANIADKIIETFSK